VSSQSAHRSFGPLIIAALLAAVVVARVLAAGRVPLDDEAFVTLRQAANLVEGDGLVFNPAAGWGPTLATSSPGQALLLSLPLALGLDGVRSVLGLNLLLDLASALLLWRLLRARPTTAVLAVGLFAVLPGLVTLSVSGLAFSLFALLALGAVTAAQERRFTLAGVAVGLALAVRPEAMFLSLGLAWCCGPHRERLTRFLIPLATLAALLTLVLRVTYGSPVPATMSGVVGGGGPLVDETARILRELFLASPAHLALGVLGLAGLPRALRRDGPLMPVVLAAAMALVTWLVAVPWPSPAAFGLCWLALAIGAAEFLAPGLDRLRAGVTPRVQAATAGLALMAALLAGALMRPARVQGLAEHVWRPMAAWSEEAELRARGATLLSTEIGAVGWYTGGVVVGSSGLGGPGWHSTAGMIESLLRLNPEYLMLHARRSELRDLRARDDLSRHYYPIRRFSLAGETDLEPALADLSEDAQSDFLLFRRRQ